ncbi:MAG: 4-hydroxy-3-methylbut-2-enyl diphosphate reductase [Bacteroidota bacterium]
MYKLSVTVDPGSGFCFGVIYAVQMAEEILDAEGQLYCLGDIVHNDEEVARLQAKGLEMITHADLPYLRRVKVLIRAHGEPPSTYRLALENELELIDASCPVILKLQNRIRQSHQRDEKILIFGREDHAEVIGLKGQTNGEATVFQDVGELDLNSIPQQVSLYSQTTKSKGSFYQAVRQLREKGVEVRAHDTICRQVSHRDEELRHFARQHDRIIFVSGKKSSNGKMLYEVCKAVNQQTHFVSSCQEVQAGWFRPQERVGICGATSTPQWLMEDIQGYLRQF